MTKATTTLVNGLAHIRYGYNDQSQLVDVTWWDTKNAHGL